MKVLVIGSGPIVIGQAAEFDYAGTQACRALREEGHEVVLVNSNPATIMTDPGVADALYIEPLTPEFLERIVARERPDALLPSLGGQTGLNLATELSDRGVLERYGVRVLGTPLSAIKQAEDRELFRALMREIQEPVPESWIVESDDELEAILGTVPYPCIVRPAYTLGGTGGGIARSPEELRETGRRGLRLSMRSQIMVERSLLGWKEVEYEVMRDGNGTVLAICNMENFDPMGVHTGDSIVIAPSQTLTDREYHMLRAASLKIISALGIEGGCNVQLAVNPESFDYYVIEVNPRVSRSSALASKATGYPIARVSAKIAVGRRLDEITNDVTGTTSAAFEPALDYVVVKIPRWPFDKFPGADRTLFTQMKATGEVMAMDRTFESAFMKAVRGLEVASKDLRHPRWTAANAFGEGAATPRDTGVPPVVGGAPGVGTQGGAGVPPVVGGASDVATHGGTGVPPVVGGASRSADGSLTGELHIRRGANLPHWSRDGATYAVTFRLADSLPKEAMQRLQPLREEAAAAHRSPSEKERLRRSYSEAHERELHAGAGSALLRDPATRALVLDTMRHFDGERYRLVAACVMPNHVHALVTPFPGHDLSTILHSWKSYSAHRVNAHLGRQGPLWQEESYDHLVRDEEDFGAQLGYLLNNPLMAGISTGFTSYVFGEDDFQKGEGAGERDAPPYTGGTPVPPVSASSFGAGGAGERDAPPYTGGTPVPPVSASSFGAEGAGERDAPPNTGGTPVPPGAVSSFAAEGAPLSRSFVASEALERGDETLRAAIAQPTDERLWAICEGLRRGWSVAEVNRLCRVDPWFLRKLERLVRVEVRLARAGAGEEPPEGLAELIREAFLLGYPSPTILDLLGVGGRSGEDDDRRARIRSEVEAQKVKPVFKMVDTCAGEFESHTPYYYGTFEEEDDVLVTGTA